MIIRLTSLSPARYPGPALLAALCCLALPPGAGAHADLEEQIERITARIQSEPTAELYLRRADLHRHHQEREQAFADLASAERLNPGWEAIGPAKARIYLEAQQPAEAVAVLDPFIKAHAGNAPALALRAQALVRLGRVAEAVPDYTAALNAYASSPPDLYLERARAQAALGQFAQAVQGLEEGLEKLGPIPGLELAAIEYLRQEGEFARALTRAQKMTDRSRAKEAGLLLEGELLEQAGRWAEARRKFQEVIAVIGTRAGDGRGPAVLQAWEKQARVGAARMETRLRTPVGEPSSGAERTAAKSIQNQR